MAGPLCLMAAGKVRVRVAKRLQGCFSPVPFGLCFSICQAPSVLQRSISRFLKISVTSFFYLKKMFSLSVFQEIVTAPEALYRF